MATVSGAWIGWVCARLPVTGDAGETPGRGAPPIQEDGGRRVEGERGESCESQCLIRTGHAVYMYSPVQRKLLQLSPR